MTVTIKSTSGEDLYVTENATDLRAALTEALSRRAYLRDANLRGANLRGADLGGANLRDANLGGANLRDAKGLNPYVTTPLHILGDQVGKIRAYKLVNEKSEGPFNGGIVYRQGETVEVADADPDPARHCAAGVNVATLDWCINNWEPGYRVLVVEFTAEDIAAIPHGSDGKFRVFRCKVVGEKDLAEIGLAEPEAKAGAVL